MDALRSTRNQVTETPAIDKPGQLAKQPVADVLYVIGPEMDQRYLDDFQRDASIAAVDMEVINGANGVDLTRFGDLHAKGRIGPNTQIILMLHGVLDGDGFHELLITPDKNMYTGDVEKCIRNETGNASQQPIWEGTIHLVACWGKAYTTTHMAHAGPVISHGHGEMLTELGNESISSLIAYVGECKRQNIPIEPLGMFYNAAKTTVEDLALAGDGLNLRVDAPEGTDTSLATRLKGNSTVIAAMTSSKTQAWPALRRPDAPPLTHDLALRFAQRGEIHPLKEVISSDPSAANASTRYGTAPLWAATSNMQSEAVKFLLSSHANVNAAHKWKGPPLTMACDSNDSTVAQLLISAGADVNLQDAEGDTALHFACKAFLRRGAPIGKSLVDILVAANADLGIRNNKGESPLSFARSSPDGNGGKSADLVKLLEGASKPGSDKARL